MATIDYTIPQYPTSRLRYFNNQFLVAQDFIDEQAGTVGRERAALRALCVAGVLEDPPFTNATPAGFQLGPGTAIDRYGRLIAIDTAIPGPPPAGVANGTYTVTLAWSEIEDKMATVGSGGAQGNTRWLTQPVVALVATGTALPDGALAIGTATVASGAFAAGSPTTAGRQYSGVHLPGTTATLAAGANGVPTFAGTLGVRDSLTVGAALGVGGALGVGATISAVGAISTGAAISAGTTLSVAGALKLGLTSNWSNYVGDGTILVDQPNYHALMIVGSNQNQGHNRWIRMWDDVQVEGRFTAVGGLTVTGGAITPAVGNVATAGVYFPTNPGGGGGDEAFLRYYVTSGETTKLMLGINNDPDDTIGLWQMGAERLTVSNGKVGIGTTAPTGDAEGRTVLLDVNGSIRMSDTLFAQGRQQLYGPELLFLLNTDGVIVGKEWGGNGRIVAEGSFSLTPPSAAETYHIDSAGSWTTTAAQFAAADNHNVNIRMYYEGGSAGHFVIYPPAGNGVYLVFGSGWANNSDAALKHDVTPHEPVLDRVLALRPARYRWNHDDSAGTGFVAQEVEALFPELVSDGSFDDAVGRRLKGIVYERFGVIAIAAIQELAAKYDARIAALEARLQGADG